MVRLLLFVCLLHSFNLLAQDEIPALPVLPSPCNTNFVYPGIRNPSFEGLGICVGPPIPWNNCGFSTIGPGPFPVASRGNCLNINANATEGETFLIFTSNQTNDQSSGTGIIVNPALATNTNYALLIDLKKASPEDCMELLVYGGDGCSNNETLLWQSGNIENSNNWQEYLIQFTADNNYRYLILRAKSSCGEGQLLADNIRPYSNNTVPTPTINATSKTICGNNSFIYTSPVEDAVFRWEKDGNLLQENENAFIEINEPGNYTVTLISACGEATSQPFQIQPGNAPEPPAIIGENILCGDGESIIIQVNNPVENTGYKWFAEGNPELLGTGNSFSPVLPGNYFVKAESVCGEINSLPFEILDGPTPQRPVVSGGAELCLEEEAILTVENPINGVAYLWYKTGIPRPIAEGRMYMTREPGNYFVVADNGCKTAQSSSNLITKIPDAICTGTGDACGDMIINQLPFYKQPARGYFDTRNGINDFLGKESCNPAFFQGKEMVFTYVPAADECVNIQVANLQQKPLGLFVTTQCEPFRDCIASSFNQEGENPTLDGLELQAEISYNFVVGTSLPGESVEFLFIIEKCTGENNCNPTTVFPDFANPDFEDIAGNNKAPSGWEICGEEGIFGPVSPDVQPANNPKTSLAPASGNTYIGITAFPGGTGNDYQEGIGQALNTPLIAGNDYQILLDLANPLAEPGDFRGCGGIEIWGGNDVCERAELLWKSSSIGDQSDWKTFTASFQPTVNFTHIQIVAALYPGCSRDYVLLDNMRFEETQATPPEINITSLNICPGEFPELSTNEVPGAAYQWFLNNDPVGTSNSKIIAYEPGIYSVEVSVNCEVFSSEPIEVFEPTLLQKPEITGENTFCPAGSSNLKVENVLEGLNYNWFRNGILIENSGNNLTEINADQPGNYTVAVSNDCGELLSEGFEVQIQPALLKPQIEGEDVICENIPTELRWVNPQSQVSFQWYFNDEPILDANSTRLEAMEIGNYYLEINGNCDVKSSNVITLISPDQQAPPILEIENVSCTSEFKRIRITNPRIDSDYLWILNDTDTLQTGPVSQLETNLDGEYQVFEIGICKTLISEKVTLDFETIEIPQPVIIGNDVNCVGDTVTLSIENFNSANTYEWFLDGTLIPENSNQVLLASQQGDYKVVAATECGQAESEVYTLTIPPETINAPVIEGENLICEGQSSILNFNPQQGINYTWYWEDKPIGNNNSSLQVNQPGNYKVLAEGNCEQVFSEIFLVELEKTVIEISKDTLINLGEQIQLSAAGGETYEWKPANSLNDPNVPDPVAQPENNTIYTVRITTAAGCVIERQIKVEVTEPDTETEEEAPEMEEDLNIPNVFSPNNDGINDVWEIKGLPDKTLTNLKIFDRWGAAVFQTNNYEQPWNGTFQGKLLPVGTYFYVLSIAPDQETITGHVSILH